MKVSLRVRAAALVLVVALAASGLLPCLCLGTPAMGDGPASHCESGAPRPVIDAPCDCCCLAPSPAGAASLSTSIELAPPVAASPVDVAPSATVTGGPTAAPVLRLLTRSAPPPFVLRI